MGHYLQANIASLEKTASTLNGGLQHILKMMSNSESKGLPAEDNFWDFFSCESMDHLEYNGNLEANTWLKFQIPNSLEVCSTGIETDDDVSELDFYTSLNSDEDEVGHISSVLPSLDYGDKVGCVSTELLAHPDPVLSNASQSGLVNTIDVEKSKNTNFSKMTNAIIKKAALLVATSY